MNTKGEYLFNIIKKLAHDNIKLNITAIFTFEQVRKLIKILNPKTPAYISIFAGRIADTGRDPVPIITKTKKMKKNKKFEIIWASTREIFNIIEANRSGSHIITVGHEFLKKLKLLDYDLEKYSLDTVQQFYDDAKMSKFKI